MAAAGIGAAEISGKTLSKPRRLQLALILGGLTAFGPLSIDMYLPALPHLTRELQASSPEGQLTLTAVLLGLAFGQLLVGPLSDSFGRRRPLLMGLAVYVVASLLCAMTTSITVLILVRFLQGLGAAGGMVISRAMARDLFSGAEATRFFSTLMLVVGLAPILAPVIGGQVLNHTTWRGVFWVLLVFGAVLLAVAAFALPESKPKATRPPARLGLILRTLGRLATTPSFMGYALVGGISMSAMFAYISGSSFVLQDVYGIDPQAYSLLFGLNAIGLVLAGQVNARIVGRFATEGRLLVIALSSAVVAGGLLMLTVLAGLPLPFLVVALFVLISSLGLILPNTTMLALSGYREIAGTASALLGVTQFVVGALAAPLVGLGGVQSPIPMASVMCGGVIAAFTLYMLVLRPLNKKAE